MEFYDPSGNVVCYVTDNDRVYSWDGRPLGTMRKERLFRLSGQLVGWLKHGYVVGMTGDCLLFTPQADSRAGPTLPTRITKPSKGEKQPFPQIGDRAPVPSMPTMTRSWGLSPF
ncbi:4-fold beta flower protein [Neoaquamicrobium sediminum]|uniref:4-fold beta flower protein n=1 Tax=Neoaquamicrobium sediminum TaxID=1849104 RepID=UPI003BABC6B0